MENSILINLSENSDPEKFTAIFAGKYKFHSHKISHRTITYFDTFDWRIFRAGFVLQNSGRRLYLRAVNDKKILAEYGYRRRPVFIYDFPANSLKDKIGCFIGPRALMNRSTARISNYNGDIKNKDNKTVCRYQFSKILPKTETVNQDAIWSITFIPLRGYAQELRYIKNRLRSIFIPDSSFPDPMLRVSRACGVQPGGYTGKINIKLKPNMPALQGVQSILQFLTDVMQANVNGIEQDIDTEFLHDFRVAVRRTRAALSQLKPVFPLFVLAKYKKEFSLIGKSSNQLRDLDVYLLNEEKYKDMIPVGMRGNIDFLFDQFRRDRETAHGQFVRFIKSIHFKNILSSWIKFLRTDIAEIKGLPLAANKAIVEIAKPVIYKQLMKVLSLGSKIGEKSEDAKLHELRLECKKLRYLLEFFVSLFPKRNMDKFIGHLKALQDNLGSFNDYSIQQEFLHNYLSGMPLKSGKNKQSIAAMGALIGTLNYCQQKVRREFTSSYAQFASAENMILSEKLFQK
ncbi:MAG: CHAD domain-containing protein [Calditrichaceae bacterium]